MKKRIAVLTATRAEYGLLKPIINKLMIENIWDVAVVATGAHLSPEFGLTYREIEADGIRIDRKIEILLSADSATAVSKSMGLAMMGFADYFAEKKPDVLLVLGDRYETLAVCCTAMNARIPIVHLYGGETTEGAVDEAIRHSITKMSYLHFTSTELYRKRVIQLGEDPERVFNVGAIGIENVLQTPIMSRGEFEKSISYTLKSQYAVVTFHPVTLEELNTKEEFQELLNAMDQFNDISFIITKANADAEGRIINKMIDEYAEDRKNVVVFESLGMKRYLAALKYCSFVLGNSSSGLIEAPSFHIPTINIGDRQKGRIQADTVINCEPEKNEIISAIKKACSEEFISEIANVENPYGDGNTSKKIVNVLNDRFINNEIGLKKKFYDLD